MNGKYGAYKQLTTPNSDLSNTIIQQEQLNNQHRREKEFKAEKQSQKNLAQLEKVSKINSGRKTGFGNIDATLMNAYQKEGGYIDQYVEAQRRLNESNNTDAEAFATMRNIERNTERLHLMKSDLWKIQNELQTGIAQGKYSAKLNESYVSALEQINKGEFDIDTSDLTDIKFSKFDYDGDGVLDQIDLNTFTDINNFGVWEADFDINDYSKNVLDEEFKVFEKVTDNGVTKRTLKGFNPSNTLLLKDNLKTKLGQDANSLTNAGKSYVLNNGYSLQEIKEKPELYEKLINDTTQKYISTRQVSDKTDVNLSALNAKNRLAFDKQKYNDKSKSTTNVMKNDDGTIVKRTHNNKNYTGFNVPKGKPISLIRGGDKIEVTEYYISDDNTIMYSGRKQRLNEDDEKVWKKDLDVLNETEANLLAVGLGFSDMKDMIEKSKTQIPEEEKKTKKNSNLILNNVPEGGF